MMLFNLLDKTLKLYIYNFISHMFNDIELLQMIKVSLIPIVWEHMK